MYPNLRSHFQLGFWATYFEKNHQEGPNLLREMVYSAQSIARIGFAAKKAHLECKYNVDFSL
jgi:hypothetical protein